VNQLHETPVEPVKPPNQFSAEERSAGVTAVDAKIIPSLDNYRVVKPAEFNPSVVSWLKSHGAEADGRVPLTLNKKEAAAAAENPDVAYLLTDPMGSRRLVIVYGSKIVFDAPNFGPISILRVPSGDIPASETPGATPEGDGLLVVADPATPEKTFLLFLNGNKIHNRPEPNWTNLDIR
jgi:hypothetical protein